MLMLIILPYCSKYIKKHCNKPINSR